MRYSTRLCAVADCTRYVHARDICATHYQRLRTTQSVDLRVRTPRICSLDDCDAPVLARNLCQLHYGRVRRTGTPTGSDFAQRFWRYVDKGDGCWLWTLRPGKNGYGRTSRDNRLQYAHRIAYELAIGPIPPGLTIDHLCRVRLCVNPDHLEPVTLAENTRREMAARRSQA